MKMIRRLKNAFMLSFVLLLVCGLLYPLSLSLVSMVVMPVKAGGSLIVVDGQTVGSELIGQEFSDPRFMQGRVSAVNYNSYSKEDLASGRYKGASSGSENLAASNPKLLQRIEADLTEFMARNPGVKREEIPAELLSSSASGLDPHISVRAAAIQIPAMAVANGLTEGRIAEIVRENTQGKFLGLFGEERVNVLRVNLTIVKEMK